MKRGGIAQFVWRRTSPLGFAGRAQSSADELQVALEALGADRRPQRAVILHCVRTISGYEESATVYLVIHNFLRLMATIAGVAAPVVLGVNLAGGAPAMKWVGFGLAMVTAAALSLDGAFNFRGRWVHNRQTAEALKRETRFFLSAADHYAAKARPEESDFVERFERISGSSFDAYVDVVRLSE